MRKIKAFLYPLESFEEYHDVVSRQINFDNLSRYKYVAMAYILFQLMINIPGEFFVIYNEGGYSSHAMIINFSLHIFSTVLMLLTLLLIEFYPSRLNPKVNVSTVLIVLTAHVIGVGYALVDITLHGQITVWLMALIFIALTFVYDTKTSLIILGTYFFSFLAGLLLFYGWNNVVYQHALASLAYTIVMFFVSRFSYQLNVKTLMNKLKLADVTKQLRSANTELNRFATIASHDMKAPLQVINNYTKLTKKKVSSDNPEIDQYLDYAIDGSERLMRMIDNLLKLTRIKDVNSFETVDLNRVLYIAKSNLNAYIEERNALVANDMLPHIKGNESLLIQLFQNLINNGIKYNLSGQPELEITYTELESKYRIIFRDNGIGINKAQHDKVFRPFERLHDTADFDGTGIGLAFCKKVVESHKGLIKLVSDVGQGSQFIVEIPKI